MNGVGFFPPLSPLHSYFLSFLSVLYSFLMYFLFILWRVYLFCLFLLFIWVSFLIARIYCWLIFLPFFHMIVETYLFYLGCYILRINFCLFHFAVIQVEEWNGAYFKEMEEGKDSAGLFASSVKMSHVFSPHFWWCMDNDALQRTTRV